MNKLENYLKTSTHQIINSLDSDDSCTAPSQYAADYVNDHLQTNKDYIDTITENPMILFEIVPSQTLGQQIKTLDVIALAIHKYIYLQLDQVVKKKKADKPDLILNYRSLEEYTFSNTQEWN